MPVETFVQTGERTVMSYLVKPLSISSRARSVKSDPTSRFRLRGTERLRKLAELSGRLRGRKRSRFVRFFGVRRTVGLAMLAALIALRIWDPPSVEDLRLRSFDFYQILKPRIPTVKPVVIVDIDEDSLRSLGQWPWPRTLVADLIERLTGLGAVAIAFDVIFAEADRLSPNLAVEIVPQCRRGDQGEAAQAADATTMCWRMR